MSTTFTIIPTTSLDITFAQIIETAENHIEAFLASVGIEQPIRLHVNIHDNEERYKKPVRAEDPFMWKANEYAWFTIEGVAGGTDAYFEILKDMDIDLDDPWWLLDEIRSENQQIEHIEAKLEQAQNLNRNWYFRRSAGQPGIINLSYGLISAAVAELTGGILWSDDCAWNYQRFPAESADFLTWYFRPDLTLDKRYGEWAQACIDGFKEDFSKQ